jgi:hypothetical protein
VGGITSSSRMAVASAGYLRAQLATTVERRCRRHKRAHSASSASNGRAEPGLVGVGWAIGSRPCGRGRHRRCDSRSRSASRPASRSPRFLAGVGPDRPPSSGTATCIAGSGAGPSRSAWRRCGPTGTVHSGATRRPTRPSRSRSRSTGRPGRPTRPPASAPGMRRSRGRVALGRHGHQADPSPAPEPMVRGSGITPTDPYLEWCWLPVVEPSTVALVRHVAELTAITTEARMPVTDLSRLLGLGRVVDPSARNNKLVRTIVRAERFGLGFTSLGVPAGATFRHPRPRGAGSRPVAGTAARDCVAAPRGGRGGRQRSAPGRWLAGPAVALAAGVTDLRGPSGCRTNRNARPGSGEAAAGSARGAADRPSRRPSVGVAAARVLTVTPMRPLTTRLEPRRARYERAHDHSPAHSTRIPADDPGVPSRGPGRAPMTRHTHAGAPEVHVRAAGTDRPGRQDARFAACVPVRFRSPVPVLSDLPVARPGPFP